MNKSQIEFCSQSTTYASIVEKLHNANVTVENFINKLDNCFNMFDPMTKNAKN